jgi:hypothetical protein
MRASDFISSKYLSTVWVAFHGEQVRGIRVMPGVARFHAPSAA